VGGQWIVGEKARGASLEQQGENASTSAFAGHMLATGPFIMMVFICGNLRHLWIEEFIRRFRGHPQIEEKKSEGKISFPSMHADHRTRPEGF
jgi:hypothetical protein